CRVRVAPCGAVGAVAESGLRVHRRSLGARFGDQPAGMAVGPAFFEGVPPHHGLMGCYPIPDPSDRSKASEVGCPGPCPTKAAITIAGQASSTGRPLARKAGPTVSPPTSPGGPGGGRGGPSDLLPEVSPCRLAGRADRVGRPGAPA